jgi:kumamolisin
MQRWTTAARLAVATTIVAATGATIAPALAAAPAGPATGVTVFLKAPDGAALQRLATAHGLTHAQRMRALSVLLPGSAEHAQAISALSDAGLKITSQSAWSVSATAASSVVSRTFGVHATAHLHPTAAEQAAATGPYPTLPASLQGVATAVYPTTGGPAAYHAADDSCDNCLTSTDFRNAYTAPTTTPANGQDTAATLTVATIQLAAWNPGDLINWANTPGNVDGPQYSQSQDLTLVPVDQATVPTPTKADNGDEEVDLDQEALYGTDPYAHQRPYFAPNTSAGVADAYSQIVDDVLQDTHAYQGGDSHIVAVSSSWGICEADTGLQDIETMEPILQSVLAAGVTIFSSSGDQGIYDGCNSQLTDVDYPASSPEAVAVGGTNLSPVGVSAPNNGTNWTEQAWSCVTRISCLSGTGGSGGGASVVFPKPSYQTKITNAPFASSVKRMVPDIAADADPASGFRIYTTDPGDSAISGPTYIQLGGTSLAAPLSAALFTNMLAAHSASTGIGDIHTGLYDAYGANVGAFRDVTQGSNGVAADASGDPSVAAGVGYDTVTGLGAPLWSAVAKYLFAAAPVLPPKTVDKLTLTTPSSPTLAHQVTATWTTTMSASAIALGTANVTISRDGSTAGPVYENPAASASDTYTFNGVPGATYQIKVVSSDITGARSKAATAAIAVPIDDKSFKFSGAWHRTASSRYYAGSSNQSDSRNSYASIKATGTQYDLLVPTGPGFGKMRVSWNGFRLMTINLYAPIAGEKVVDVFDSGTRQARTFRFTVLSGTAKGSAAFAATVGVDALIVQY